MSFEVAVVCAAQGEAAGAGSAGKLFFFSSCSFYSTYFCNHTTSFEAQWEANRKQLCYTKNKFKTQDTQITALVPPPFIFFAFWEIGSSKFSRRRRDSPGCERDKMMSADHELVNLSEAVGCFR